MDTYEKEEKDPKPVVQYFISGKQVNINTGNGVVNARQDNKGQNIEKQIVIINKQYNNYTQKSYQTGTSSGSDNGLLFLGALILLAATSVYVEYRWHIRLGIIAISLVIELITILIYYKGKKKHILYDKNLKEIATFNMLSIIMIPILIGVISSPIYNNTIDFKILEQEIVTKGMLKAYLDCSFGKYAMFQMVGLLFVGIFLIYIVISDLYIIAVLNIVMEKKGQWFWRWLLRRTCGKSKDGINHIKMGMFWLMFSIILTIGVLPYVLNLIEQNSQMIGL